MALVTGFFLILKMFTIYPYAGDEHIYIYQAQLIADGYRPYVDFALAHPPVHALFTALILKVFGYGLVLGRLLPVGWCLVAGLLLGIMVKREYGIVASVVAVALFLLAYEPLRASSHYTGVNMTVALLIGAVLTYRLGWMIWTAALCVLAVYTRLYAGPGVLALTLFALIAKRRDGLKLVLWGGLLGLLVLLALGLWTDFGGMKDNLVSYHVQKTPMAPRALLGMRDKVLFHNFSNVSLFVLALIALFASLIRGYRAGSGTTGISRSSNRLVGAVVREKLGLVILSGSIAALMLLILLQMDRVWMYYFIPSFPFGAVLGGWLVSKWVAALVNTCGDRGVNLAKNKWRFAGGGMLFMLFIWGEMWSPRLESQLDYYPKEMSKPPAKRVHKYEWKAGYLPETLNRLVRETVWKETRTIGETYNRFNFYLWHESRVLDILDDVVRTIDQETLPDDEIFGDSGTVPLFALMSGRRIAANQVDTNIQRYRSGAVDPDDLVRTIDTEKLKLIILRHRFGVGGLPELQRLIRAKYRRLKVFRSDQGTVFLLFKRK